MAINRKNGRTFRTYKRVPGAKTPEGRDYSNMVCFRCRKNGHPKAKCDEKTDVDGKAIKEAKGGGKGAGGAKRHANNLEGEEDPGGEEVGASTLEVELFMADLLGLGF